MCKTTEGKQEENKKHKYQRNKTSKNRSRKKAENKIPRDPADKTATAALFTYSFQRDVVEGDERRILSGQLCQYLTHTKESCPDTQVLKVS